MTARPHPPQLRELLEVIPVGQAQTHDGWSVTCLTAERYDDGIRVTFRVFGAGHGPGSPELALVVGDDRDGQYRPWGGGGNGAANRNDCDWRLAYNCTPALDPQARELRLVIAAVQLMEADNTQHRLVVAQSHSGPWIFTVPLPGKATPA